MANKGRLQIDEIIQVTDKSIQDLFTESFYELEQILETLKTKKLNSKTTTGLKNYLIIRLVSLIESFCKDLTRKIIDGYHLEPKGIFEKDEIKISILDLDEIKKNEKITVGRIISKEINFQNPQEIDFVFSKLICDSFFSQVKERANTKMFSMKKDGVDYFFNWDDFHELFKIRHGLIHEMSDVNFDYNKSVTYYANSLLFLSYALSITTDKAKELGKIK
ncbi:hypothetical protein [Candidatus Nitrosotalea okcheonensis]|uniref:RiboL-PSP-HEPN domain-containing protein n=1 Tax=Candidatus Nitrosotalea okcheonensis TaxID=1903276 RepID=A0A2H1FC60_9ARCH|nr:hypothetical protein [Candidatus Nitrosotalea okcheonensis]SMH70348.1 protein of unknown function [Candidatus Nitrosotalea okcheonensis]